MAEETKTETKETKRIFVYEGREYPDPDPKMSIDEVRKTLTDFFPELANAENTVTTRKVLPPGVDPKLTTTAGLKELGPLEEETVVEFKRRVGTKGAQVPDCRFCEHLIDTGGPITGRYMGMCEFRLAPLTCGKFVLAAWFKGHDPR